LFLIDGKGNGSPHLPYYYPTFLEFALPAHRSPILQSEGLQMQGAGSHVIRPCDGVLLIWILAALALQFNHCGVEEITIRYLGECHRLYYMLL